MNVSPEDVDTEVATAQAVFEARRERGGDRRGNRDVLDRPAGHVVRPEDRQEIITDWQPPEENGGRVDWVNAPRSYDEWYRQYLPEAQLWVRKSGVHWSQIGEVVDEIMTRFIERDSLGVFRPTWETRSASGRSNFRSYFSNFVVGYATGKHRNNVRYLKHNSFIFDAQVGDDGTTWADLRAPLVEDAAPGSAEFVLALAQVRATVGNRELVDAVLMLAAEEGGVKQSSLRRELGCSAGTAKTGLEAVRAALRAALAETG